MNFGVMVYVRYMDDFVLWSGDREYLVNSRAQLQSWLRQNLALELKKISQPQQSQSGINFLGCQIFPGFIALNRRNRKRMSRRIRNLNSASVLSDWESRRQQEIAGSPVQLFPARYDGAVELVTQNSFRMKLLGTTAVPTASTEAEASTIRLRTVVRPIATGTRPTTGNYNLGFRLALDQLEQQ